MLARLTEQMFEARRLYDETLDGPSAGREGVKASLAAVLTFVHALPGVPELGLDLPLAVLGRALVDLDRGSVEPVLCPAIISARPKRLDREILRSDGAAAAELLRQSGMSLPAACERVAKTLSDARIRLDGDRPITAGTIGGWRKEAREADNADPLRVRYQDRIRPENLRDPKLAAEQLLAALTAWRSPAQKK